jgi:hypothetical protein
MNSGFMGKRICAHDGFVGLHRNAGVIADQLAHASDLGRVDAGGQVVGRMASLQRHHHLFEGRVSGAFADAVDRHFSLARSGLQPG